MGDNLDGDGGQHFLESSLGGEPATEARARQQVGSPQAKSARDDNRVGALCQGDVSRHTAKRETEAIERGDGQAVCARQGRSPERLVVSGMYRAPLDGRQPLVEFEARIRRPSVPPTPCDISCAAWRGSCPRFHRQGQNRYGRLRIRSHGRDRRDEHMRHAEAAARADDTDHTLLGQGDIRPAEMARCSGSTRTTAWPTAPKSLISVTRSRPSCRRSAPGG